MPPRCVLVTRVSQETLLYLLKELFLFLIGAICPSEKSTSLMAALLLLTSTTSLSNWNGKQPALPFKSAPTVSDNTQSYTSKVKAEKMHNQSLLLLHKLSSLSSTPLIWARWERWKEFRYSRNQIELQHLDPKCSSYVTLRGRDKELQDGAKTQFKTHWIGRPPNFKYFINQLFSRDRRKLHTCLSR